jgi:predicted dehydrogenase
MSFRPMKRMKVGIIGCGNVSGVYFSWLRKFPMIELVGCADLDFFRAETKAQQYNVKPYAVQELLDDKAIQLVVNLVRPQAHSQVNRQALEAGKHVYCEKPLALSVEEGREILELAQARGLRVGGAPDTFLGGGLQTARKLIDDGAIGRPVAAAAHMACPGHESWHPDPEFFYQAGGGPMLDMGPYYLTAMVNLLGPIVRATGSARTSLPERTITSEKKRGTKIPVAVPTHYAAVYDFTSGPVATVTMSFDVQHHRLPFLEIYGTEGTLSAPDPNTFAGPVALRRTDDREWREIPLTHTDQTGRGMGVADMIYGILYDRPHRASGALALHVLEAMLAVEGASHHHVHAALLTTCERPAALPPGLAPGELDL